MEQKMRLVRREKPAAEKPLTDDELNAALIEDAKNPGERFLNSPPGPVEPPGEAEAGTEIPVDEAGDNATVAEAMQQQTEADDSKNALLDQLNKVRAAEQLQRQQYSRLNPPQTREQWVAALMQQSGTTRSRIFARSSTNDVPAKSIE
jgi:hypothetical protein